MAHFNNLLRYVCQIMAWCLMLRLPDRCNRNRAELILILIQILKICCMTILSLKIDRPPERMYSLKINLNRRSHLVYSEIWLPYFVWVWRGVIKIDKPERIVPCTWRQLSIDVLFINSDEVIRTFWNRILEAVYISLFL